MKKSFNVDATFNDMRIDRWIRNNLGNIPQGLIEKSLRSGKIKLNNKKAKSSHKVKTDDVVNLFNFDYTETIVQKKIKFLPSEEVIKENEDLIIDNNDDFIVLNKSSGIAVQGGTKSKKNLVDIFARSDIFQNTKPFSVHRLDKDTSGVFIMAKHREAAQLLTSLFRLRKVHKTYLAICHGELQKDSGEWNDDLTRYDNDKEIIEKASTEAVWNWHKECNSFSTVEWLFYLTSSPFRMLWWLICVPFRLALWGWNIHWMFGVCILLCCIGALSPKK